MELHLGLALSSSSSSSSSSSRFDLNYYNTHESPIPHSMKRKHSHDHVPQTLMPLLVFNTFCCNKNHLLQHMHHHHHNNNNNNNNDGDAAAVDDDEVQSNSIFAHHRNVGGVIGWPPVKLCRKKVCLQKINNRDGDRDGERSRSKSKYVKVHMEGVGIARKVDLNMHQCYQTLVHTLASMFGKCYEDVKLTYQDKEGDWLLAGDVPWGSFIKTIQRLRLIKK